MTEAALKNQRPAARLDRLVGPVWSLDLLIGPHFDRTGLPVLPGDILRVWHFVARRRKTIWMYKKVFRVNGRNQLADDGEFLSAVAIADLGEKPVEDWHKCLLQHCGEFEVIDGRSLRNADGTLMCWWERPRLPGEKCDICGKRSRTTKLVGDGTESGESDFMCADCRRRR